MSDKFEHWFMKWLSKYTYLAAGMTLGQTAYYPCKEEDVPLFLREHENAHKTQFARYGFVGYMVRWWYYAWKYGYQKNPLEIEASKIAYEKLYIKSLLGSVNSL